MAQPVPYTGAPELSPRFDPTPAVGINTPPAAFGVNIGEAVEHLGTVDQKAGGELLDRAFAMQELHAHGEANAAIADFQNQSINKSTAYMTSEGNTAVQGLGPHIQDLDKTRADIGAKMSSPYAQFLYDQESRQSRFRMAWVASEHAAGEGKKYIVGSGKARVQSLESEAELDPDNPTVNKDRLDQIKGVIANNNTIAGLKPDDPQWDMNIKEGTSSFIASQVRGMANKDPFKAQKLLNQAMGDKDLVAGTIDAYGRNSIQRLQDYVDNKLRTVGSRVVASQTMSGEGFRFGNDVVPLERAQQGIKAIEGGHYGAIGPETKSGHGLGAYQVMNTNLSSWLSEAGMPAMSEQEFLASRDAQDQLFNTQFGKYMEQYGSFNRAAKAWFSGNPDADLGRSDGYHTVAQYLQTANHGLAQTASLRETRTIGTQIATEHAPGNSDFQDAVDQRITGQWENNQRMLRDDAFNNQQTLDNVIVQGDQGGKVPTTVEELTATPGAKEAWEALNPKDQMKYMNILAANAKGDLRWNDERMLKWQMLQGLLPEQPDKFLSETNNAAALDLPWGARQKIISQRQQVYSKTYANPNVSHALQVLGDQLQATGLVRGQDEENRALFTGILHDALQEFQANNSRPPKDEEIKVMGQQILKQVAGKYWGNVPWFESPTVQAVPEDAAKIIREDPTWSGVVPSAEMVRRVWIGKQFQELYGKKDTAPKVGQ